VTNSPRELRLASVGLYNVGIACGAVGLLGLIGAATIGRGLAEPSLHGLLILVAVLVVAGGVGLEVNVRTAYVAVSGDRLRWRLLWEGWQPHNQSIQTIDHVELSPKGDAEIHFTDGHQPLRLSAKEFRRDELRELARMLPVVPGSAPS